MTFDPGKRLTVEQALEHPYLEALHDPEDEPSAMSLFDFEFEKLTLTKEMLRGECYLYLDSLARSSLLFSLPLSSLGCYPLTLLLRAELIYNESLAYHPEDGDGAAAMDDTAQMEADDGNQMAT